jgi:endoglycosylceramidase
VNVVYKSPPYHPVVDHFDSNLSYSIEDMELLNSLGVNVVRLGVMWPGVEPERGEYNTTYIDLMKQLIEDGYANDIYTLVDAHQDVLSEKYCGEGVPLWAAESSGKLTFPLPLQATPFTVDSETGIPLADECAEHGWGSYYATEAASTAFQNLYENYDGLRTAFAQSWAQLAAAYKDLDGVIGFELLNEPWAGDIYSQPSLLYPGVADKVNLAPFYEELASAIREEDDDRLIFFESVTWSDQLGDSKLFGIGFTQVPGGDDYQNRSVFSYHYYNPPNFGSEDKYFSARVNDATTLGCAGFLTEFNLSTDEDTQTTMDFMDTYLQSWMGWEYKSYAGSLSDGTCTGCGISVFNDDGSKNEEMCKIIARTYPIAVAGRTSSFSFNASTGRAVLKFTYDASATASTEVYISEEYYYPNGVRATVDTTQVGSVETTVLSNLIKFDFPNGNDGAEVTITIRPT